MSGGLRGGMPPMPPWVSAQVSPSSVTPLQKLIRQRMALQNANIQSMHSATVSGAAAGMVILDDRPALPLSPEAEVDPSQPDTLGWRAWYWYSADRVSEPPLLISPHMHTPWRAPELHVEQPWDDQQILRGMSGIHARLMPRDWRKAGWPMLSEKEGPQDDLPFLVTGVVERFGRYVMGTTGWRAEWVVIRALMAKTTDIGLALESKYPDIPVYYREEEPHGHR